MDKQLLWTCMCQVSVSVFNSVGIYLKGELLNHVEFYIYLFEKQGNFPTVAMLFYIPTSKVWAIQFIGILAFGVVTIFILAILIHVWWDLIVILICNFLWLMMVNFFSYAYLPSVYFLQFGYYFLLLNFASSLHILDTSLLSYIVMCCITTFQSMKCTYSTVIS